MSNNTNYASCGIIWAAEGIFMEFNKKFSVADLSLTVIAALIVFMMLRPVTHQVPTEYDDLTISTFLKEPLEITDREAVRGFVDLLNTMTFRGSWRLSNEAPDQLRSVIQVINDGAPVMDVWVLLSDDETYFICVWVGSDELVAKCPEMLEAYIAPLMEHIEQAGNSVFGMALLPRSRPARRCFASENMV